MPSLMVLLLGGLVGLDSLQVHLLHSLQLDIRLRVAASALAKLTKAVVLVKVELGAFQILVDVLTEHLLEVAIVGGAGTLLLLGAHLAVSHLVEVATAVTLLRRLALSDVQVTHVAAMMRSSVV